MLEMERFMLNNRGMTLIETLLAFSIFISSIVVILSCYNQALKHHQNNQQRYLQYLQKQKEKELTLWLEDDLSGSIKEVLP